MRVPKGYRVFYEIWTLNEEGQYDYRRELAPGPSRFWRKRVKRMGGK